MKLWTIIILLFESVALTAQYYRPVGGLFAQYDYTQNNTYYIYPDSANHKLYFVGVHTKSLTDTVSDIVIEYDDSTDSMKAILQLPTTYSNVGAMAIFDGNMYVGGGMNYTSDYHYWVYLVYGNGQTWDTVPVQPNSDVECLQVWNNQLYVGGDFSKIGTLSCSGVAMYDGQNWHALPEGNCFKNPSVVSMAVFNNELYATGYIYDTCNSAIFQLARYTGTSWEAVLAGRLVQGRAFILFAFTTEYYM